MAYRALLGSAVVAAALLAPQLAGATTGRTTGAVALRSGPGVGYDRLTVLPAGTRIKVYRCAKWCEVIYGGYHGWVAGRYVSAPRASFFSPIFVSPFETSSGIRLKPVYVAPAPAYLASTPRNWCSSWERCAPPRPSWYTDKVFYHQGRWWDRPDVFIVVGR